VDSAIGRVVEPQAGRIMPHAGSIDLKCRKIWSISIIDYFCAAMKMNMSDTKQVKKLFPQEEGD
jgi:hypothetical protein